MPFATSYQDEELLKKNQQAGEGVNISGGQAANFATGVPGQEAGAGSKDKKSSGQYANIQSYLDANTDQADQMGSTIASNVTQKADDATTKIQDFESKAPVVKAYDPNAAYQNLGKLSDEQKNEYRTNKSTGGYTGPQSVDQVEGYQDTMKAANEASQQVANAGSESGQQALLKDTYKRPDYSAGMNRLDQVLLQNSAGSKDKLQGLSQKYAGLSGMFDKANEKVGGAVNSALTQSLANKEAITGAEKTQWDSLVNPIQARAAQMNIDNPALYGRVNADASDEILNDETLAQLGLSEGQDLYDLNLQSYLNQNPDSTNIGLNEAANTEERSRYQALADLVGDPTRTQIGANAKDITPVKFRKDDFAKDVAGKKAEYERQRAEYRTPRVEIQAPGGKAIYGGGQTIDQLEALKARNGGRLSPELESILTNFYSQFHLDRKIKKG